MKIVSVMTTDSSGGAEFAAMEMLEALRQRGHETVMLTDMPGMGRDTAVQVRPVSLGPKLSTRSWIGLAVRWPILLGRLRRALQAEAPYDVLMVHYKKEQLLAGMLPQALRRTVVWAEWGPVPFPLRKGLPRRAYLRAADRAALVTAISEGTRSSVAEVGVDASRIVVVPNVLRTEEIRFSEEGRSRVRDQ
ncbi:MAG TPA: glycosyltransferase, partial [Solirubrobacteraceae bacterium]